MYLSWAELHEGRPLEYIQVFTVRGVSPVTDQVIEVDIIADSAGDARNQAAESGLRLVMVSSSRLVAHHRGSARQADERPES